MSKALITNVAVGVAATFLGTWLYAQWLASRVKA